MLHRGKWRVFFGGVLLHHLGLIISEETEPCGVKRLKHSVNSVLDNPRSSTSHHHRPQLFIEWPSNL